MAPESLDRSVFDEKTDVWSFGVTLWEVLTRGLIPYATIPNNTILQHIRSGKRLPKFGNCPFDLYDLMRGCWRDEPKERPSFTKIATEYERTISKLEVEADWKQIVTTDIKIINEYTNTQQHSRLVAKRSYELMHKTVG